MKEKMDSEPDRVWMELYRESALQRMLLQGGTCPHRGNAGPAHCKIRNLELRGGNALLDPSQIKNDTWFRSLIVKQCCSN